MRRKGDERFVATEENANKIETWNKTGGHWPTTCIRKSRNAPKGKEVVLRLGECAVNCYTQWFSGLSCPQMNIPTTEQYEVARARLSQYNMIIVLEWLKDPAYAKAVEDFFGVPGVTKKRMAFCERTSRQANRIVPLVIKNETIDKLTNLNEVDIGLYKELTDCDNKYEFPEWNPDRFDNATFKVPYYGYAQWKADKKKNQQQSEDEEPDGEEEEMSAEER